MKYLIIILISLLSLSSCKSNENKTTKENNSTVSFDSIPIIQKDSVRIDLGYQKKFDSLILVNAKLNQEKDSIDKLNHIVAQELLHKKLIIENAKTYLNIVNKNPTQQKFLRGWMNRALNQ